MVYQWATETQYATKTHHNNRQVKKLNLAALVCAIAFRDIAYLHLGVSSGQLFWW